VPIITMTLMTLVLVVIVVMGFRKRPLLLEFSSARTNQRNRFAFSIRSDQARLSVRCFASSSPYKMWADVLITPQ
jgi:hypothetical protein